MKQRESAGLVANESSLGCDCQAVNCNTAPKSSCHFKMEASKTRVERVTKKIKKEETAIK